MAFRDEEATRECYSFEALRDLDVRTLHAIYGGAHGAWGPIMIGFTLIGTGWSALALLPLIWHSRTRNFAAMLAIAVGIQAALVWILKRTFGRVRPWIALGLPQPVGSPHDFSFPSGHAAGCFCVAAFVVLALPATWPAFPRRRQALVTLAAVIASLVALSRVYLGAHFPTDVAAGALLGALVGTAAGGRYASMQRLEPAAKKG
jgi:membrane-associated phospholipid phosphatase